MFRRSSFHAIYISILVILLKICSHSGASASVSLRGSKLNILTLGGSVTWGATLESRDLAYPSLMSKEGHNVHNLAIRASDAQYPSLCIESLLLGTDAIDFDVIVMEYSLNGFNGFSTLIKRLQYRYPNAAIVYLHLYSLISSARRHPDGSWTWQNENFLTTRPAVKYMLDVVGAYDYNFPFTENVVDSKKYFAKDRHHLSALGHQKVADDLLELISATSFQKVHDPQLEEFKWGEGDQCENWFELGKIKGYVVETYDGGDMKSMVDDQGVPSGKMSIEFRDSGTLIIYNKSHNTVPVYIFYMSAPHIYPLTLITLGDTQTTINPHRVKHHTTEAMAVGWAQPGKNYITIKCVSPSSEPFRIVGVALFGFSYNMVLPFMKSHNMVGNLNSTEILN